MQVEYKQRRCFQKTIAHHNHQCNNKNNKQTYVHTHTRTYRHTKTTTHQQTHTHTKKDTHTHTHTHQCTHNTQLTSSYLSLTSSHFPYHSPVRGMSVRYGSLCITHHLRTHPPALTSQPPFYCGLLSPPYPPHLNNTPYTDSTAPSNTPSIMP
eukprot:GHVQ01034907.1.p1 GENE.GHVQ01034907.1~~GHVQ01034907.1.p1  ORF type:complete len:153 (-),score=44.53 GHVQ01034907.1:122-580(-)